MSVYFKGVVLFLCAFSIYFTMSVHFLFLHLFCLIPQVMAELKPMTALPKRQSVSQYYWFHPDEIKSIGMMMGGVTSNGGRSRGAKRKKEREEEEEGANNKQVSTRSDNDLQFSCTNNYNFLPSCVSFGCCKNSSMSFEKRIFSSYFRFSLFSCTNFDFDCKN